MNSIAKIHIPKCMDIRAKVTIINAAQVINLTNDTYLTCKKGDCKK